MHGAGNDYVYINCIDQSVKDPSSLAIKLSDRNFGIGGDGLVLILNSETEDFRMRMFNADGSEGEMCGNAIRCVAKYLYDRGHTKESVVNLETLAGKKVLELNIEDGVVSRVRVDMGKPVLKPADIPVSIPGELVISASYKVQDEDFEMTCISIGNPHAVFFVDELNDYQVLELGPKIEADPLFPNRVNAHFAKVVSKNEINMRVWERGSGETMACGTGACAVLVAAVLTEQTERIASINLPGGTLEVEWAENDHVYMTGPAEFVFDGEIEI